MISKLLMVALFGLILLGIALLIGWKLGIVTFYSYKIK